jgi:hypothetical protein
LGQLGKDGLLIAVIDSCNPYQTTTGPLKEHGTVLQRKDTFGDAMSRTRPCAITLAEPDVVDLRIRAIFD